MLQIATYYFMVLFGNVALILCAVARGCQLTFTGTFTSVKEVFCLHDTVGFCCVVTMITLQHQHRCSTSSVSQNEGIVHLVGANSWCTTTVQMKPCLASVTRNNTKAVFPNVSVKVTPCNSKETHYF